MTDSEPFETFMLAYQDMVFTTALRLLGNEAEAQDVAQEVFLKAFERFGELHTSPTAGGWLKTVTRNLCLNHLTRYRARWKFFTDHFTTQDDEDAPWDIPVMDTQEQTASEQDQKQLLDLALQKLPTNQRVPLVLYHFEELSYEEIAVRMKISLSKVKTDIHRARETLRKKLSLQAASELVENRAYAP